MVCVRRRLVDWRSAIVLSVTLVLLFGEILPSAVFTGKQKLMLSASLVPVVQCLLFIMYPVAWPLGKMLDCIMGDSHGSASRFNRQQLQTMVRLHQVRAQTASHSTAVGLTCPFTIAPAAVACTKDSSIRTLCYVLYDM